MSPFENDGIDHLVLRVNNLADSRKFYEGLLGCVMERVIGPGAIPASRGKAVD